MSTWLLDPDRQRNQMLTRYDEGKKSSQTGIFLFVAYLEKNDNFANLIKNKNLRLIQCCHKEVLKRLFVVCTELQRNVPTVWARD